MPWKDRPVYHYRFHLPIGRLRPPFLADSGKCSNSGKNVACLEESTFAGEKSSAPEKTEDKGVGT